MRLKKRTAGIVAFGLVLVLGTFGCVKSPLSKAPPSGSTVANVRNNAALSTPAQSEKVVSEDASRAPIGAAQSQTVGYKIQLQGKMPTDFDLDAAIKQHRERAAADPVHVLGVSADEERYLKGISKSEARAILGLKVITDAMIPIATGSRHASPVSTGSAKVIGRRIQADSGQAQIIYPEELDYGDHIVTMRSLFIWNGTSYLNIWHHAIVYVNYWDSNPLCIEYPNVGMRVRTQHYNDIELLTKTQNHETNYAMYKLYSPINFSGYEAAQRAEARLRLSSVDLTESYLWDTNNCEHLVRWCREGVSYSAQAPLAQSSLWSKLPIFSECDIVYRNVWFNNVLQYSLTRVEQASGYSQVKEEAHVKWSPGYGLIPLYNKEYWYISGSARLWVEDCLLTTDINEANYFEFHGSVGYISPIRNDDYYHMTRSLYRFYQLYDGYHVFTSSDSEAALLRSNPSTWRDEGCVGYTW